MIRHLVNCGRVHFGPVCVNGGPTGGPICMWCDAPLDRKQREQIQRTWDTVKEILLPHRYRREPH